MKPSNDFESNPDDDVIEVEIPDIRDSFQKTNLYKKVKMTLSQKEKFKEYLALPYAHIKSLSATNYWRIYNGMGEIPVPPQDKYYWKYFDSRIYDVVKKKKEDELKYKNIDFEKTFKNIYPVNKEEKIQEPIEKSEVSQNVLKDEPINLKEQKTKTKQKPKSVNNDENNESIQGSLF